MAKKQEIVTRLTADAKGLHDALDKAQDKLKQTGKEAEKTAEKVKKAVSPKSSGTGGLGKGLQNAFAVGIGKAVKQGASGAGKALGNATENAVSQGLTKVLGVGGPAGTMLQGAVKSAFAGGTTAALASTAVVGGVALLAKKFGDGVRDEIKKRLDIAEGAEKHAGGDSTLYQQMQKVSASSGTSIDTLSKAYDQYLIALEEAKNGNVDMIESFADLGVRVSTLTSDASGFLTALGGIASAADANATAMAVFGANSKDALKAFNALAEQKDDLTGIVSDDAIEEVTRLKEAWENLADQASDFFSPISDAWSAMVDGIVSGTADLLEALAGADELTDSDLANMKRQKLAEMEERRKAEDEARKARADEERRKRNEARDKRAAQYQDQQQRDDLRRKRQRDKITEQYNLAGMSEQERRLYNRRKYSDNLVAQGFSPDEAERITQRLYDAQFRGKAASQANPEPERERWKQDYMRRYGVNANVAEDAARRTYDYRQQEQPAQPNATPQQRPLQPISPYRAAVLEARRNAKNEPYQWRNTTPVEPVEQDDIGQYGRGNIDLYDRPRYVNEDGSVSTVRSMSFNDGESEVLVPTISRDENNRPILMSDDEAIDHYYATGEHLGKFSTPEEADAYAEKLHLQQERLYAPPRASQPAHSYAEPLPAPSPAPQQTAQMLGAILQAVQSLQKNTYVVE